MGSSRQFQQLYDHVWPHSFDVSVGGRAQQLPALPALLVGDTPCELPLKEEGLALIEQYGKRRLPTSPLQVVADNFPFGGALQVDATHFRFSHPMWAHSLASLLSDIKDKLGISSQVVAVPSKLLLSRPGDRCRSHRSLLTELETEDIDLKEKTDDDSLGSVFGSLLIQLPSRCEGGSLHILDQHFEQEYTFGSDSGLNAFHCHYASFYHDVAYELAEVTAGSRVVIVYDLRSEAPLHARAHVERIQQFRDAILQWDNYDNPILLPLAHTYCRSGLADGLASLKGRDREFARFMQAANETISNTHKRMRLFPLHGSLWLRYEEGEEGSYPLASSFNVWWRDEGGEKLSIVWPMQTQDISGFNDDLQFLWKEVEVTKRECHTYGAGRDEVYGRYFLAILPQERIETSIGMNPSLARVLATSPDWVDASSTVQRLNFYWKRNRIRESYVIEYMESDFLVVMMRWGDPDECLDTIREYLVLSDRNVTLSTQAFLLIFQKFPEAVQWLQPYHLGRGYIQRLQKGARLLEQIGDAFVDLDSKLWSSIMVHFRHSRVLDPALFVEFVQQIMKDENSEVEAHLCELIRTIHFQHSAPAIVELLNKLPHQEVREHGFLMELIQEQHTYLKRIARDKKRRPSWAMPDAAVLNREDLTNFFRSEERSHIVACTDKHEANRLASLLNASRVHGFSASFQPLNSELLIVKKMPDDMKAAQEAKQQLHVIECFLEKSSKRRSITAAVIV